MDFVANTLVLRKVQMMYKQWSWRRNAATVVVSGVTEMMVNPMPLYGIYLGRVKMLLGVRFHQDGCKLWPEMKHWNDLLIIT